MELCSLRSVLECLRKPSTGRPLSVALICDFAIQIADAMAYLENRRIVHRSLAARNVLMFEKDKVCQTDRTTHIHVGSTHQYNCLLVTGFVGELCCWLMTGSVGEVCLIGTGGSE